MQYILDFFSTTAGGFILAGATVALSLATLGTSRWAPAKHAAEIAAAVSPLWLLAPLVVSLALALWGSGFGIIVPVSGMAIPILFIVQVGLGVWIVYRHRHWPVLVIPLTILCGFWQWGIAVGVAAEGLASLG